MSKEQFIATLQACYFGERNAFEEIVSVYDELVKENEKLNHYKLLYQKVKERNDKAIEYIHKELYAFDFSDVIEILDSESDVIEILKSNNEE